MSKNVNVGIFKFFFINIDFSSKVTTFKLLVKELLHKWNTDRNTEQELIKIIDDLCDVYILIDGLDEAENGVFSNPSKTRVCLKLLLLTKSSKISLRGVF